MPRYYEEHYFENHAHDQLSGERDAMNERILDRIEKETKDGKLFDIGCGCGFFLKTATARGWQATGIDPSEKSIQFARSVLGDAVRRATLDDLETADRFQAVTLINVLDHLQRPWDDLRRVHELLEPGGLVFIRVPNGGLHLKILNVLRFLGTGLEDRLLVFHEFSFTPAFLKKMLSDSGFRDIHVQNAQMTGGGKLRKLVAFIAGAAARFTGGSILLSPSLEITGKKNRRRIPA